MIYTHLTLANNSYPNWLLVRLILQLSMEELESLWIYQGDSMDEMKQMLFYSTLELESEKTKTYQEMQKNEENLRHLVSLLKTAYQERDEAREQLQKLLKKFASSPTPASPGLLESLRISAKTNLAINKANITFRTPNPLSDTIPSRDFLNANMGEFSNAACSGSQNSDLLTSGAYSIGQAHPTLIDDLAKGKVLPEKGKFLKAVMEAGPLLQTLLLAGALPRWRIPPPPLQVFKTPPFNGNRLLPSLTMQARWPDPRPLVQRQVSPQMNLESSMSMLNHVSAAGVGCSSSYPRLSKDVSVCSNGHMPPIKRPKFH